MHGRNHDSSSTVTISNRIRFEAQSIPIDCSRIAISIRIGSSGTAMAAFGSEHSSAGSSMYIKAEPMYFRDLTGLSGDVIFSLFEDREGNVWVATNGGLDRFRELAGRHDFRQTRFVYRCYPVRSREPRMGAFGSALARV